MKNEKWIEKKMANEYREMKEDELKKENRYVEKREGGV